MIISLLVGILSWLVLFSIQTFGKSSIPYSIRGGGGSGQEAPQILTYQSQVPSWMQGLPEETLNLIRQGVGQQIDMPSEYGISSQALQNLLQYQPSQFQYPMQDIQAALASQQQLQYKDWMEQIKPQMYAQGQGDSSYFANMIADYLQGQQSQSLTNTANLLTNQATQNYDLSKWLPTMQSQVAGQLGNLGTSMSNLNLQNIMLPYQTYLPQMSNWYGTGLDETGSRYDAAMNSWKQSMKDYEAEEAEYAAKVGSIGQGVGLAAALALAIPTGGASLAYIPTAMSAGQTGSTFFGGSAPQGGAGFGDYQQMFSQLANSWGSTPSTIRGGYGGTLNQSPQYGQTWSPYNNAGQRVW